MFGLDGGTVRSGFRRLCWIFGVRRRRFVAKAVLCCWIWMDSVCLLLVRLLLQYGIFRATESATGLLITPYYGKRNQFKMHIKVP